MMVSPALFVLKRWLNSMSFKMCICCVAICFIFGYTLSRKVVHYYGSKNGKC